MEKRLPESNSKSYRHIESPELNRAIVLLNRIKLLFVVYIHSHIHIFIFAFNLMDV